MYDLIKISTVIIIGLIFYTIAVIILKSDMILSTQWFKTTIWLEFLALLAIFSYGETLWFKINQKFTDIKVLGTLFLVIYISMAMIVTDSGYFSAKPYRFFYGKNISDEEDIAMKIKALTQKTQ